MKTVAIIPCLNERKYIGKVVREAKKHVTNVVVSDGFSTDGTPKAAMDAGAMVVFDLTPELKTGYGVCIRNGIKWARQNLYPNAIVLLDGDGQHDPSEIPKLLNPIKSNRADVVMGCRVEGNMPAYRKLGNWLLSGVCNVGASFRPPDAVSGYWAFRTIAIPQLVSDKWGLAVEILIKSRANGWRMASVPVRAIYHENYEDNSTVSPLHLGLNLLGLIIKWRLQCEIGLPDESWTRDISS